MSQVYSKREQRLYTTQLCYTLQFMCMWVHAIRDAHSL